MFLIFKAEKLPQMSFPKDFNKEVGTRRYTTESI